MPSGSTSTDPRIEPRWVPRLVGSAFGFFVWAAHLLVLYIAEAVACQLAAVSVTVPGAGLIGVLAIITMIAALIVVVHAGRMGRQRHTEGEDAFLARIGIGQDAIATLAILWQLIPLFTVPLCR